MFVRRRVVRRLVAHGVWHSSNGHQKRVVLGGGTEDDVREPYRSTACKETYAQNRAMPNCRFGNSQDKTHLKAASPLVLLDYVCRSSRYFSDMPKPILSTRSRISAGQADKLLGCYSRRKRPAETAKLTGLSLNTVYEQYARIRQRLIEVGYYRDAALNKDETGLSEKAKEMLRHRRGLEYGDIYSHAAEVIEWLEEWPSGTVLRQLRKIIDLTGPIDIPWNVSDSQAKVVFSYVRYARSKLLSDRSREKVAGDAIRAQFAERAMSAADKEWRSYRACLVQYNRNSKG